MAANTTQIQVDPQIEQKRQQLSAIADQFFKIKKTLSWIPGSNSLAQEMIKQNLVKSGKPEIAAKVTNENYKKLDKLFKKKNKDALVSAALDIEMEGDPRAGIELLKANKLEALSDPEIVYYITETMKQGTPTAPPTEGVTQRTQKSTMAMQSQVPPPSKRNVTVAASDVKIETEVGGEEFDVTAASRTRTKILSKTKSYEAKKSILYPWRKTEIEYIENVFWKEPCFTSPDDIVPNKKKEAYTKNNFTDTFYRAYYSISELPLFGWSYHTAEKGKKYVFPRTFVKFLYCFFVKVVGSPLYIAYQALRILYMLGAPLLMKIPMILVATINTLVFTATTIAWVFSGGRVKINGKIVPWFYYKVDKVTGETLPEPVIYYPALTSLMGGLFGLSIPFHTISPRLGSKYGRGEIGIFVFIVMAISAVIITVTGVNIAVIFVTFVYFMLKILFGIKDKAMGIDLRKGGK